LGLCDCPNDILLNTNWLQQRVSNIALPQAQHKATSPTRKTLAVIVKRQRKQTKTIGKFKK